MVKCRLLIKIKELKNKNKTISLENQELVLQNKKVKEYETKLKHIRELIEEFDYRKSNSVSIIRKIENEVNN